MTDLSGEYQRCRWYDDYPQLKLALSLLELAPAWVKQAAFSYVSTSLGKRFGYRALEVLETGQMKPFSRGRRWYDETALGSNLLELVRMSPPMTKHQAGEQLLAALSASAA